MQAARKVAGFAAVSVAASVLLGAVAIDLTDAALMSAFVAIGVSC